MRFLREVERTVVAPATDRRPFRRPPWSQTWTLVIWLRGFSSYVFAQIYAINSDGHNFCSILVINLRPYFQIFKIGFYLRKNYS